MRNYLYTDTKTHYNKDAFLNTQMQQHHPLRPHHPQDQTVYLYFKK